jgi:hypothetical protein
MTATKSLGIWMDHARANLMELTTGPLVTKTLESRPASETSENTVSRNEFLLHHKEQDQRTAFYKSLMEEIKKYQEVVLFGPTTAKKELANLMKWDNHFKNIKVIVKHADKMTEKQQHAFVREHFLKTLPSLNTPYKKALSPSPR